MKNITLPISKFTSLSTSTLEQLFKRIIDVCGTAEDQELHTGKFGFTTEIQRQEENRKKLTQAGTGNALYPPVFLKELIEWVLINKRNKTYLDSKYSIDTLIKRAKEHHFIT